MDYAYINPNNIGKDLLNLLINKWMTQQNINNKIKEQIYERTINNILKYENSINNIEEILMIISLQIIENYFFN